MWKGAVAFGLVNVPVKLYTATSQHDVSLHMVHREDGGRIRYRKTCTVDGEEVPADEIARAHTTDDGQLVVIDEDDLDSLPVSSSQEIEVQEFVPAEQVDPIMFDKTYYLEPEARAAKPYALLREALRETDRMAVVTVTMRRRESMAVLRVRDDVIVLQTLLWPDEVRAADFEVLRGEVDVRPQELAMASSLVESLASDFDPEQYSDSYTEALRELIAAKAEDGDARPAPVDKAGDEGDAQIVDLMAALRASVERTGTARRGSGAKDADTGSGPGDGSEEAGSGSFSAGARSTARSTAKKPSATRSAASKATAGRSASSPGSGSGGTTATNQTAKKQTATRKTAARKTAAKQTAAAKTGAAKTGAARTSPAGSAAKKTTTKATATKTTAKATAKKATTRRAASKAS